MGIRLKITLKSEKKFILLADRPLVQWCDRCGAESRFVNEDAEASLLRQLAAESPRAHRLTVDGRAFLCLRSISDEP